MAQSGEDTVVPAWVLNHAATQDVLEYSSRESFGCQGASLIARVLYNNNTLTKLNLANNHVGDEGARALCDALVTNQTVTHLDLRDNVITDVGIHYFAEMLKTNCTLQTLDIQGNLSTDKGSAEMAEMLKQNTTLTRLLPINRLALKYLRDNRRRFLNLTSLQYAAATSFCVASCDEGEMHSPFFPDFDRLDIVDKTKKTLHEVGLIIYKFNMWNLFYVMHSINSY